MARKNISQKQKSKKPKLRIPMPKPTVVHQDKSKYSRKIKHKKIDPKKPCSFDMTKTD